VRQAGDEAADLSREEQEKSCLAIDGAGATPAPDEKHPAETQAGAPLIREPKSRRVSSLTWLTVSLLAIALVIASFFLWRSGKPEATGGKAMVRSIAVLPFKPLVADNRDESLEMGIADTLIFRLSSIRGTVVRPISAVRKYTELNQDPLAAGREQQVDAVLDGSIQKVGDRVRVMARLLSVADGSVLWTDKGEQGGASLFAVQDAIAEKLAGSLAPKLTEEEKRQLTKPYTENAEAYRLYLLGRYFVNKRTPEGYQKGIEYFQQAIETDPANALAHSGLADCYTLLGGWQILPPNESFVKARAAAERALALDDSLAEAHTSLALVKNYSSDWPEAEAEFKRAIALNPNNEAAHRWYGAHLMGLGRLDEALAETRRALEFEPLSLPYNTQLGRIFYLMRAYDQAIEQYRKTLEIDPNFVIAHLQLGWAYEKQERYEEAIAQYQKTIALQGQPGTGERVGGRGGVEARIGRAYALSGRRREAQKALDELHQLSTQGAIPPYNMALIYEGLGEQEQAIAWLEKVFEVGSQRFGLKTDPTWDGLRSHPRFQHLLRRIELAR
jgi:tetratricopeptide (TPR) repeat protein